MAHATTPSEKEAARGAGRYYVVWIALLAFTALTVIVARIHLGHGAGLVVAMLIATVKATLVALFFMHLWDHAGASRLILVTSVFFVALLMGLTVLDSSTRFQLTNPPRPETIRQEPPGPDILSPTMGPRGTSTQHEGARDRAPQEHR